MARENFYDTINQDSAHYNPKVVSKLTVVVIARNEEQHIANCLNALKLALQDIPDTRIIVIDSCSADRTVEIASRFSIEIYRYQGPQFSAAAGRRVGFSFVTSEFVLFLDGDCCIEQGWVEKGLAALESMPSAAVAYGSRREVFENTSAAAIEVAPTAEEYGLGGNALYRSDAMRQAGGFNPYIQGGEEGELLARIKAEGFHDVRIPDIMFTHFTDAKTSVNGYFNRIRRGLSRGGGTILRESISQGLFIHHAKRFNRHLLSLGYIFAGILSFIAALIFKRPIFFIGWGMIGLVAFATLWWRRKIFRSALFIAAEWLVVAIHIPGDFIRPPRSRDDFEPIVERLQ